MISHTRLSHTLLRAAVAVATLALPVAIAGCETEEDRMRERIIGEYVTEIDETVGKMRHREHHVLTLMPDGRWKRSGWAELDGRRHEGRADFGTYRIQGVTLNLRSLVEAGMPYRYTISGDTLFSANAGQTYALTGLDIGDGFMVRKQ